MDSFHVKRVIIKANAGQIRENIQKKKLTGSRRKLTQLINTWSYNENQLNEKLKQLCRNRKEVKIILPRMDLLKAINFDVGF